MVQATRRGSDAPPAPGAHFLNNVLAAAASYVEEDPDLARDLLAELGAFLAYRLRRDLEPVPLDEELAFTRSYLRLEQGRFPDRLQVDVAVAPAGAPPVTPLVLQERVQDAVGQRLRERPGALRVALRPAADGRTVRLDLSDWPGGQEPERVAIDLGGA
ncbi:histidine kinase [Conexibacter sp. SYSU D00693]|uniref:histidine kinase n=1 Tax=Conexibacter sp. SYSU D00693 TaxID=2812560 RepID=UPI00196B5AB8|nr:histidine kinase [Conexibacter sp. SYSU D00693]